MADNAQAKADSIRYGVSFDGMTINLNDKAAGNVYFTVHYMNVFGKVKSDNVTLNFNEKTPDAEEITSIVSKKHVVTEVTETAEQAFISDLKPTSMPWVQTNVSFGMLNIKKWYLNPK